MKFQPLKPGFHEIPQLFPTALPAAPREDQVSGWLDEWRDYASDATLTAASDVNNVNVVRWIRDADSSGVGQRYMYV